MAYISQSKTSLSSQDRNYLLKEWDRRIIQSESPQGKAGEDVGQLCDKIVVTINCWKSQ